MPRFSPAYLEQLLCDDQLESLVELQGIILGSPYIRPNQADYGLPAEGLVFVETLAWFTQALRSGAWTYFEATSEATQVATLQALVRHAPAGYAERYSHGARYWHDGERLKVLDEWIEAQTDLCEEWLRRHLRRHQQRLSPFYA